jgi:two-component system, NtrC family, response regulator AtoC
MGCIPTPKPLVQTRFRDLPPEEVIFGSSRTMEEIRRNVEKAASADIPVLLQGETGTGKEVLARFLHGRSCWGRGCFVQVNCPAVPGALIESELFGYEKGAFTGAFESKPGRIEHAIGGTLFLDEIAELDFGLQAKLLQLLQDGQFFRIGAQKERQLDARVVCATNRQLKHEIRCGTFRRDLFYRISVMSMELPRLEERSGDIPMLVAYFLEKYSKKYGCAGPPFSNSLLRRLQQYRWPGNIRELENLVKRYVIFGSEQALADSLQGDSDEDHLGTEIPPDGVIPLKKATQEAVKQVERKIILQALEANGWHRGLAARALKISYGALLYKMKEAGLPQKRRAERPDEGIATVPSWAQADVVTIAARPPIRSRSSRIKGSNLGLTGD